MNHVVRSLAQIHYWTWKVKEVSSVLSNEVLSKYFIPPCWINTDNLCDPSEFLCTTLKTSHNLSITYLSVLLPSLSPVWVTRSFCLLLFSLHHHDRVFLHLTFIFQLEVTNFFLISLLNSGFCFEWNLDCDLLEGREHISLAFICLVPDIIPSTK